jgi:hypothetical protein
MKLGVGETRLKVTITQQALDSSEIRDQSVAGETSPRKTSIREMKTPEYTKQRFVVLLASSGKELVKNKGHNKEGQIKPHHSLLLEWHHQEHSNNKCW